MVRDLDENIELAEVMDHFLDHFTLLLRLRLHHGNLSFDCNGICAGFWQKLPNQYGFVFGLQCNRFGEG